MVKIRAGKLGSLDERPKPEKEPALGTKYAAGMECCGQPRECTNQSEECFWGERHREQNEQLKELDNREESGIVSSETPAMGP